MSSQKNKGGRPSIKPQEKRTHQVKVTFNEQEFKELEKQLDKTNLRTAEYIRATALKHQIKPKYTNQEQNDLKLLHQMRKVLKAIELESTGQGVKLDEKDKFFNYLYDGIDHLIDTID
jgi:hypothetical protein